MAILYGTREWMDAAMREMNSSQAYKEAAKNWEGDMYIIIEPDASFKHRIITYYDLWHGECRSACVVSDENEKTPEFRIRAPLDKWRKVLEQKLNPIQGMLTGQLKIKGNMSKIIKTPRAAVELVNCCSRIPTEFP